MHKKRQQMILWKVSNEILFCAIHSVSDQFKSYKTMMTARAVQTDSLSIGNQETCMSKTIKIMQK